MGGRGGGLSAARESCDCSECTGSVGAVRSQEPGRRLGRCLAGAGRV